MAVATKVPPPATGPVLEQGFAYPSSSGRRPASPAGRGASFEVWIVWSNVDGNAERMFLADVTEDRLGETVGRELFLAAQTFGAIEVLRRS
jgi:hypothetical protein